VITVPTLLLTAFGPDAPPPVQAHLPADATRLLPARPQPQTVASIGTLRLQLPIAQSKLTAIGYHPSAVGALALRPQGRQANEGLLARAWRGLFGGEIAGLEWYQLGGAADGPRTAVLNVGAAPGTDVYAPVDGTVVGLTDFVRNRRVYGARIEIQPSRAPSLVVSLTHLRPDPSLSVGSPVTATTSKIGKVVDLARVEQQALAEYTQDAGNHVKLEVRPSATIAP
jgi:hypothetical protein